MTYPIWSCGLINFKRTSYCETTFDNEAFVLFSKNGRSILESSRFEILQNYSFRAIAFSLSLNARELLMFLNNGGIGEELDCFPINSPHNLPNISSSVSLKFSFAFFLILLT